MGGDRRHGAPVPGAAMAPAHADPANAPSTRPFPITGGGTTYPAAVVPRQGGRTPALVTTSNDVCMPDRGGHVTLAFPVPQELFRTGCVSQQDPDPAPPKAPVTHWSRCQLAAALLPHAAHRFGEGQRHN